MTDTFPNRIEAIKSATEAMKGATSPQAKADAYKATILAEMARENRQPKP